MKPEKVPFRLKQFFPPITPYQWFFDLTLGIGLPLFFLYRDSFIFKIALSPNEMQIWDNGETGICGLLADYRAAGYGFFLLLIVTLVLFLVLRRDLGILAGFLTVGTTFYALAAVVFTPVAIVMLLANERFSFILSVCLFFMSLFLAFIYFRNTVRAYYGYTPQRYFGGARKKAFLLGILITLLVPIGAQLYIDSRYSSANEHLLSSEESLHIQGIEEMKSISLLAPPSWMTKNYLKLDRGSRARYAEAFLDIYGRNIREGIPSNLLPTESSQ